jgi:D-3-phosphoglycerate dehydrogenase
MTEPIDEDKLVAQFASTDADAVFLKNALPFTRRVVFSAKNLKIISRHGVGFDTVDVDAATERGIAVMVPKGANADAVAEHALTLMLSLARDVPGFDRGTRKGKWKRSSKSSQGFRGRTVGILGYGQIGSRTAQLAHACGAHVLVHSRSRIENLAAGIKIEENLNRFLSSIDILSLHCSLNEKTKGMIGQAQIDLMKDGAYLVNTARGALVDDTALIAALESGKLAGAGIDTYTVEPVNPEHPLLKLDNVICTPHIGSATEDAMLQCACISAQNIVSYLRGEAYDPANLVNPKVLARAH